VGKRKQPLEETPERPTTEEDEGERQHEARAAKRANKGDGSYAGPRKLTAGLTRRRSARLVDHRALQVHEGLAWIDRQSTFPQTCTTSYTTFQHKDGAKYCKTRGQKF
jgi:NAD-dependent DNA ligase